MSLNKITVPPRFLEALNIDEEAKKQVNIKIGRISESEALIMFDSDVDKKMVTYLKRMARSSWEYKNYMSNFKDNLGMTSCKVFNMIDINDIKVGLEIHHTPFAMETIVMAVINRMVAENGYPIDPKDVSEEVMRLHYDGVVGLIPLTTTIHEAVHSGSVYIKPRDIYGDYQKFFEQYEEYLSEDAIRHYNNVISLSEEEIDLYNKEKLKRLIAEYNVDYGDSNLS